MFDADKIHAIKGFKFWPLHFTTEKTNLWKAFLRVSMLNFLLRNIWTTVEEKLFLTIFNVVETQKLFETGLTIVGTIRVYRKELPRCLILHTKYRSFNWTTRALNDCNDGKFLRVSTKKDTICQSHINSPLEQFRSFARKPIIFQSKYGLKSGLSSSWAQSGRWNNYP